MPPSPPPGAPVLTAAKATANLTDSQLLGSREGRADVRGRGRGRHRQEPRQGRRRAQGNGHHRPANSPDGHPGHPGGHPGHPGGHPGHPGRHPRRRPRPAR
ncbi:hypothetical protein D1J60_20080 [Streptomyces sp. W1SF4]|nr:hypothetical protein D1J60_20080 [Streptomyces sp. W1SF4]